MAKIGRIRFWQLMVGTGFGLLLIGLVMIFLPSSEEVPFLIEFFQARVESTEMGLALIVLGLSCFLIGSKDLADLRTYQGVQQDLDKTSTLAARLVADRVSETFKGLPAHPSRFNTHPELDVATTRRQLETLQLGESQDQTPELLDQAERGLELIEALKKEGFSI